MSLPVITPDVVPCALCERPGSRELSRDRVHYTMHCPCCGTFEISDAAIVFLHSLPVRVRRALCAACVAQLPSGVPMRISIQDVARLAAPYL